MKNVKAGWISALLLVMSGGTMLAHHSLSQFDTTTPVTVTGVVVALEKINPHSFIFIDQKDADGKIQRWALEGPSVAQLARMGFFATRDPFKVGDPIEACGYILKNDVESQRTLSTEPTSPSPKTAAPKSNTGRVLTAEYVVIDGQRTPWGDYGHHKCFGPGYVDIHSR